LKNYNVVVFTEVFNTIDTLIETNKFCHENGVGFICTQNLGAAGYVFLDYGKEFLNIDADGEEVKEFIVSDITQENPAICTVHEDKRHKFQDGDFVKFRELEGMPELNEAPPIEITVIDGYSFKLKIDATGFGAYKR
jgi:ubiquitin-activating enzyme E1